MSAATELLAEAKERFKLCRAWEGNAAKRWLEDYKFANADPENGYQWPNDVRRNREVDQRPTLTINKTRVHNLHILNDMRQNPPGVKIVPVGDGATKRSAEVFEGVVRHIEYNSNAQAAYQRAANFQVISGIGYWRIITGYAVGDSFDQEIFIKPIIDPLGVYLDPDIREFDGSDARFGFIFENMSKKAFEKQYPKLKNNLPQNAFDDDGWVDENHVRVAEYFRRVEKKDRLLYLPDVGEYVHESTTRGWGNVREQLLKDPNVDQREIVETTIEWYKIAGGRVIEEGQVPGSYIPIVRVVGEETVIDGSVDRKGHTRALKDAQRMYNYWSSQIVEALSIQTKSPWIAPAEAIEGYEQYWNNANRINTSVLPYNQYTDDGKQTVNKPERPQQPTTPPGFIEGLRISSDEMRMVTGQYEPVMGETSNERSGRALNARQRQGDRATYHYIDNMALAIRLTGKILLEWIPKVYDTERVLRIIDEEGKEQQINIKPDAKQALQEPKQDLMIFNPLVGKYDVRAESGPAYATRRQEAYQEIAGVLGQRPELIPLIGDLLFRSADWPLSDKIADRLERMVPAEAKGEAPPPEQQQAQEQVQNMQQLMTSLTQTVAEKDAEITKLKNERNIEAFKAESERMKVLGAGMSPDQVLRLIQQLMQQALQTSAVPMPQPQPNGQLPMPMMPGGMPQ